MSLLFATIAINVAIPVIGGLIEKAINRWNDEIPSNMLISAQQEYDLLESKVAGFINSTGGVYNADYSRPLDGFSASTFLKLQQVFVKYAEITFIESLNMVILGLVNRDNLKIKSGENMMLNCASNHKTSLESHNKFSFDSRRFDHKYEQALQCIERMTPSNRMPRGHEVISYGLTPVYHLNCSQEDVGYLKEHFGHIYEVDTQETKASILVRMIPKVSYIIVEDLSKIYGCDVSSLTVGEFFGKNQQNHFISSDSNVSKESVLKSMLGHSLLNLREVIHETLMVMISSLSMYNTVDNVVNLYRRCEHGPWINNISTSSFTKFTEMFVNLSNKTMIDMDKDFKVMGALIRLCALKQSLFPNLKSNSEEVIERFVSTASTLYEPLSPGVSLYPSIVIPEKSPLRTPIPSAPARSIASTKFDDETEDETSCLYDTISEITGIEILDKTISEPSKIDIKTLKEILNVKKIWKDSETLVTIVNGKKFCHCMPTFRGDQRTSQDTRGQRESMVKQLSKTEDGMKVMNGVLVTTIRTLFQNDDLSTRSYRGYEDEVQEAYMTLFHRPENLKSTSIDSCFEGSISSSHNDCLRSVMKIVFNCEVGDETFDAISIDSEMMRCFKVLALNVREIGNIHLRSYRYSDDDERNHIEIDDAINKFNELYLAKRDCEIKTFSIRDYLLSPAFESYRKTKYYSSIVSQVNYEKYAQCLEFDLKVVITVREEYKLLADVNPEFASWLLSRMICDITRLKLNTWKDVILEYGFMKFDDFSEDVRGPITVMLAVIDKFNSVREETRLRILSVTSKVFASAKMAGESLLCVTMSIIDSRGVKNNVFDCIEICNIRESTIDAGIESFISDLGVTPTCSRLCPRKLPILSKHGLSSTYVSKSLRTTGFTHVFK